VPSPPAITTALTVLPPAVGLAGPDACPVVAGELVENNLSVAAGGVETRIGAGKAFCFGPEHIHRLNGAQPGSVSVHAYSPPLWRMGQYAVSGGGVLRRTSVSYADELRPLEEVAA